MEGPLAKHRYEILVGGVDDPIQVDSTDTYWYSCGDCDLLFIEGVTPPDIPGYFADPEVYACPNCWEICFPVALDRCRACFALVRDEGPHICPLSNVTPLNINDHKEQHG